MLCRQEYAQRKEKMLQLRKQKEEEVFQQKQAVVQPMQTEFQRADPRLSSCLCALVQAARNAMIDAQAFRGPQSCMLVFDCDSV